jgi:uncharacterized protein YceK
MRKFAVPFVLLVGLSGCASLGAQDTENRSHEGIAATGTVS